MATSWYLKSGSVFGSHLVSKVIQLGWNATAGPLIVHQDVNTYAVIAYR